MSLPRETTADRDTRPWPGAPLELTDTGLAFRCGLINQGDIARLDGISMFSRRFRVASKWVAISQFHRREASQWA